MAELKLEFRSPDSRSHSFFKVVCLFPGPLEQYILDLNLHRVPLGILLNCRF